MSNLDLKRYITQMLLQLADLADARTEDEGLGAIAFDMRLLADRSMTETSARRWDRAAASRPH